MINRRYVPLLDAELFAALNALPYVHGGGCTTRKSFFGSEAREENAAKGCDCPGGNALSVLIELILKRTAPPLGDLTSLLDELSDRESIYVHGESQTSLHPFPLSSNRLREAKVKRDQARLALENYFRQKCIP